MDIEIQKYLHATRRELFINGILTKDMFYSQVLEIMESSPEQAIETFRRDEMINAIKLQTDKFKERKLRKLIFKNIL